MSAIPGWVTLCGNLAPFAAIVVFLAPMPTINQISTAKSVGSLPLLPYSCMIANCFLWTTYGFMNNDIRIWGSNGTGLICALYYCWIFIRYCPSQSPSLPGSIRQHVQANMLVLSGTGLFLLFFSSLPNSASYIGNVGVIFCVAMFGSPLAAIRTVIQTKSAVSIPLPFTLATVLNCSLWSVAGVLDMQDPNIYVPNLLGLACGLMQVGLKGVYGNRKETYGTTRSGSEEMLELME